MAREVFYLAVIPIMRLAIAVAFEKVRVIHGERVPRSGALLLVANHPSTWADVLLLDVVLKRPFHFLAQGSQFRPWARGLLLNLYGTLPLWSREQHPDALARNAETIRRCELLFDRGSGVAVFPEGVSRADRGLLPLKHGAARLALSYARRNRGRRPFSLVPVGIDYADRTAFRCDVTITVGEAIPIPVVKQDGACDPEDAARRLTERMAAAMEGLVSRAADRRLWGASPEAFSDLERRVRRFERIRNAIGVSQSALAERTRRDRAIALLWVLAGAAPALAGLAIHAIPAGLTQAASRRYGPSEIAFARIASGFLFLSMAYAGGAAWLLVGIRIDVYWLLVILPLAGLLGVFAVGYTRRLRTEWERCRLAWISRRHEGLIRRARRERRLLLAQTRRLLS